MAAEILPAAKLDTAGITATLDLCDAELATTRLAVAEARVGLVTTLDPDVSSRPWTACAVLRESIPSTGAPITSTSRYEP